MMWHDDVYKAWCSTKHEKHNIKHDIVQYKAWCKCPKSSIYFLLTKMIRMKEHFPA